jgi:hypothetical protein
MDKICLIGFGNIGFRYFEAIYKLQNKFDLYIVDINSPFKKGYEYLKKNKIKKTVFFLKSLNEINIKKFDLVIISTTCNGRLHLIKKVNKSFTFKNIIIEKPITQSETELVKLKKILPKNCWINSAKKSLKIYKDIKKKISTKNKVEMKVEGNNWGICCNSLHYIELFNFFCKKKITKIQETKVLKWVKSKRKGFFDLHEGEMKISYNNNLLFLNSSKNTNFKDWNLRILITNGQKKWEIFQKDNLIVQNYNKKKTSHKVYYISEYMTQLISNILKKNHKKIYIPNFSASFILFKPVIRFFLKKWRKKHKKALIVPIT